MSIVEDIPESSDSAYTSARDIPLRYPPDTEPIAPLLGSITPPGTGSGTGSGSTKRRKTVPGPTTSNFTSTAAVDEDDEDGGLTEEVFDTVMLTVPFSFLFVLLHILVHLQYSHRPTWDSILNGLLTAIPTLGISLFYANRHASHTLTRGLLMAASLLSGARLIWLVNKASWSLVTAQAPAMGTIWILTIVQLPLLRGLLCLLGVGVYVWYTGLNIYP